MAPACVVVALGVNATSALIASQVVLSLTLPVPMIALLILTQRHDIMGSFANRRFVAIAAAAMAAAVLALNGLLILQAGNAALAL
jgi:manganese transport protein